MSHLCFVLPEQCMSYGVSSLVTLGLAEAGQRRGLETTLLRQDTPDFPDRLREICGDGSAVLLLDWFLQTFLAEDGQRDGKPLVETLKARTVVRIADHPFSTFMHDRIRALPRNTVPFCLDPGFERSARLLRPDLPAFHKTVPFFSYGQPVDEEGPAFGERPIDLLIPMTISPSARIRRVLERLAASPGDARFCAAFYEAMMADRRTYPLDLAAGVMADLFSVDLYAPPEHLRLDMVLRMMSSVEGCVRNERRRQLVSDMLREIGRNRVVIVTNEDAPLSGTADNVQVVLGADASSLGRLMRFSRTVLHAHPTYPDGQHERVVNAMGSGAVLVSDPFPEMERAFRQGSEWLETAGGMTFHDVLGGRSARDLEDIARAGRERIAGAYLVDHVLETMLAAL